MRYGMAGRALAIGPVASLEKYHEIWDGQFMVVFLTFGHFMGVFLGWSSQHLRGKRPLYDCFTATLCLSSHAVYLLPLSWAVCSRLVFVLSAALTMATPCAGSVIRQERDELGGT